MMYDLNMFTLTALRYTGSNYVNNVMGTILRKRRDSLSLHSPLSWFLVSFGNLSSDGISTMTNLTKQAPWAWLEPRQKSGCTVVMTKATRS